MAESETDLGQLTDEQQLALQQYTAVTDQELGAAIPLLRKCEWNVQIAITQFFDGEPAGPVQEEPPHAPAPQSTRRVDTLTDTFQTTYQRPSSRPQYEAAPRVSTQSESQINRQSPFLLSLFLAPANIIYSLFSRLFGFVSYLFPFLPRLLSRLSRGTAGPTSQRNAGGRRPLGPQDTTARFLREFEEEYGAHTVPFLETGYSRAFDLAKRDLKFLLTIPISPEHDLTASFVRNILLSDLVTAFLNNPTNNVILWAGSIQDSEPYQVASSLSITKFPTVAVIAHTPSVSATAMSVLTRITAPTSPEEFLAKLQTTMTQHAAGLDRARSARTEQQASRNLREQQESAYERSLAQDRERARQKREAETAKAKEEQERREAEDKAQNYARNLAQWRRWRASRLPAEPASDVKDAVRISLRLLNGERIMRKFKPDADIEEVYALAECWEEMRAGEAIEGEEKTPTEPKGFPHMYEFRLVSPMPRQVYGINEGGTVKDRIGRSGNLIVERIEGEDEEAEGG